MYQKGTSGWYHRLKTVTLIYQYTTHIHYESRKKKPYGLSEKPF
jgi:hypothetical protein